MFSSYFVACTVKLAGNLTKPVIICNLYPVTTAKQVCVHELSDTTRKISIHLLLSNKPYLRGRRYSFILNFLKTIRTSVKSFIMYIPK